jgi:hypothetical protein
MHLFWERAKFQIIISQANKSDSLAQKTQKKEEERKPAIFGRHTTTK